MVSSGNLPDAIWMDRGADNAKLAGLGLLADLAPLKANNPDYDNNVAASTQEFLKVNGVLYGIPNWSRKAATGGNELWMYDQRIYTQAGSPSFTTFNDLYNYAKYVKDNIPKTAEGADVVPMLFDNAGGDCLKLIGGFARSFGSPNLSGWYTRIDGKLQMFLRSPIVVQALLEANKWYRDGLIQMATLTDTHDQMVEKQVGGRAALQYYDFSQDDSTRFRLGLIEAHPDDNYVIIDNTADTTAKGIYLPADGVNYVYADTDGTVGWNVSCIFNNCQNKQRIFDMISYLLTKEGSILTMYGPQGDNWDTLDANGIPQLKTPESQQTSDEKTRLGVWNWMIAGQSDNIDTIKFAVNNALPADLQSWVITNQQKITTPLKAAAGLTDEYNNLSLCIDSISDLGVQRQLCEDTLKAGMAKIITAATADDAQKQINDLITFCDANGMKDVEAAYDQVYQANCAMQGGTVFNK